MLITRRNAIKILATIPAFGLGSQVFADQSKFKYLDQVCVISGPLAIKFSGQNLFVAGQCEFKGVGRHYKLRQEDGAILRPEGSNGVYIFGESELRRA